MADLAEILTLEHLAIRHIRKESAHWGAFDQMYEFHRFLKECHIEVEEKIFFPVLKESSWKDSKEFFSQIDMIIADHKLINTLFQNLAKWNNDGNRQLYAERLPLYFKILEEHNDKEENLIFPRWAQVPPDAIRNTVKEALNVEESFGIDRYLSTVGMTKSGFSYTFRT